uniref:Rhodanese domain-containing protein n=1 Tax=Calcidiscus leptoporus TaxID=127549 RepID=A0A7S0IVB4_9EUKA|mmetsp:Transcript_24711/g.57552  ORF Transcript_24711/g.57552 Transcript_24711/m.57552 type:complete len:444 (+) Transcript_24711:80-1411(+)
MRVMHALRRPRVFAALTGSISGFSVFLNKRATLCAATSHADAAGLTTGADFDEDGAPLAPPLGRDDGTVAKLGKPPYATCCPTGTVEYAQDLDACDNAVQATVKSLVSKMSTHPPKFLILYGSLREDSYSRKVAIEAGRILASFGSEVRVFDPTGLPIYSGDTDPKSEPKVVELRHLTRWCEGMVWVSPEIHGNISAAFKNQIDWMPLSEGAIRPTQGKTVAVMQVEAGSQSFNTVNNLRVLGRWMRCVVVPNQSSIPQAYKEKFDANGALKDTDFRNRVIDVVEELFKYTLLLRDQQPYLLQRFSERRDAAAKRLAQTKQAASAAQLRALSPRPLIIDVRSAREIAEAEGGAAVEGSVHVPLNVDGQPQSVHETTAAEFAKKLQAAGVTLPVDSDAPIVTHCTAGDTPYVGRGARAAALLRELGYANTLNGGSPDSIRAALQ